MPFPKRIRPAWLGRDLSLLFAGRALRSVSQAFLAVTVPLYLARLDFSAVQIGVLFSAGAVSSALLTAAVGFLSDRFGRKTLLILIALLSVGGGIAFAFSGSYVVLVLAGALGTIGRGGGAGSGGAMGPFAPAEQALIGELAGNKARTSAFGFVSFVGVVAGAAGSLFALIPAALKGATGTSLLQGYRVLFLLSAVLGVALALVIVPVREGRRTPAPAKGPKSSPDGRGLLGLSRPSWNIIWRFMVTNATNGLAIGFLGPFVVYWFFRRFGTDAAEMGLLFFIINLAGAVPDLLAGRFARKLGAVKAVVAARSVSVVLLAIMATMPSFLWAAALFLVRMVVNTLSNPIRQSYLMGIIDPRDRSSAAGLSNLPSQVGAAISPSIGGYLMQQVAVDVPLELAAALQGINTVLYYVFFRNIHPPEERGMEGVP
jgi:MFS family permease